MSCVTGNSAEILSVFRRTVSGAVKTLHTLAAAFVSIGLAAQERAQRPNILFVFSDDHAPHAIGAYGGPLAALDPTPNIDRLAAQGMLFRRSYCTNSLCGPSRAVILTGKHSHVNGFRQNGDKFDGEQQTFPKLLRAAGYSTALIGKWHLNSDPQGFDHWDVLPGQGDYYNPVLIRESGRRQVEGYVTDVVTDLAIDWLESGRDPEQPFLLILSTQIAHAPVLPAAGFEGRTGAGPRGDFVVELDTLAGRLLDLLAELEIDDDTLVLFNSDNGPETLHTIWMREDHQHDAAGGWRGLCGRLRRGRWSTRRSTGS